MVPPSHFCQTCKLRNITRQWLLSPEQRRLGQYSYFESLMHNHDVKVLCCNGACVSRDRWRLAAASPAVRVCGGDSQLLRQPVRVCGGELRN